LLARAGPWLLEREAEHNLLLGISRQLIEGRASFEPPVYLATIEEEGDVVGCAFRTPPYKLGLTRMPRAAVPAVATDVGSVYASIPAVLGPEAEAHAFADAWCARTGAVAVPGMRHRIYQLDRVVPPHWPPGRFRPAEPADRDVVIAWFLSFGTEAGLDDPRLTQTAEARLAERTVFLWDDGGPRSMGGWTARTPNGVRIAFVYTPPEHRGRGYATALTAMASQRALDSGFRFCFLYTDLANPISNTIYQRIGYRPVCDVVDVVFGKG
jgi:hypothetical protein